MKNLRSFSNKTALMTISILFLLGIIVVIVGLTGSANAQPQTQAKSEDGRFRAFANVYTVDLVWPDLNGAKEVVIYRLDDPRTNKPDRTIVIAKNPKGTKLTDQNLTPSTEYLYRLVAISGSGVTSFVLNIKTQDDGTKSEKGPKAPTGLGIIIPKQ